MSEHTPGPWVADKAVDPQTESRTRAIYHMPDPYTHVEVIEAAGGEEVIASDADAFLIAAAPEMLEALQSMLSIAQDHPGAEAFDAEIKQAQEVVAKAKGETE